MSVRKTCLLPIRVCFNHFLNTALLCWLLANRISPKVWKIAKTEAFVASLAQDCLEPLNTRRARKVAARFSKCCHGSHSLHRLFLSVQILSFFLIIEAIDALHLSYPTCLSFLMSLKANYTTHERICIKIVNNGQFFLIFIFVNTVFD